MYNENLVLRDAKIKVVSLQAPSVVFIDELDAVGRERGLIKGSGGQERDATLNQVPDIIDCVIVFFVFLRDEIFIHYIVVTAPCFPRWF